MHGNRTSSGERYDHKAFTCASLDYNIGTVLRVTRTDNGKSVDVRVNDCGPHRDDRIIDLSGAAAEAIDMIDDGIVNVRLTVIRPGKGRAPCGRRFNKSRVESYEQISGEPSQTKAPAPRPATPPIAGQGTYRAEALESIDTGFGVQVASYRDFNNAQNHVNELKTKGFTKILIRLKGNVHQVVLGPFDTRESAAEYNRNLLRNYKIRGFVTSLEG